MDGEPHTVGEKSGGDVTEVPARDTDHKAAGLSEGFHPCVGIEIIESLGEKTGNVYGVGRCQYHLSAELAVHKRAFHEPLAIVEHSIDLDGCDIASKGGELTFLDRAYLAFRIEHVDMDSFYSKETVGHSRAGVAACSDKHVDLTAVSLPFDEILQQAGHEAGAHIFKGESRAMEELEAVDCRFHLGYRAIESEGVADNPVKIFFGNVFAKKCFGYRAGYLMECEIFDVLEKFCRETFYVFRHEESSVGGQTFDHRFLERCLRCCMIGAVIFHDFAFLSVFHKCFHELPEVQGSI